MEDNQYIYLDYASTTPADDRVLEAMQPYWNKKFANANALHGLGKMSKQALEDSRVTVANALNARPEEVIFTSSGTESNSLAIFGVLDALGDLAGKHIITSAIEHPSVLDCFRRLETKGARISIVGVTEDGVLDMEEFAREFSEDTTFVSVMSVNNEIGTIQPITAVGKHIKDFARKHKTEKAFFHTDASQSPVYLEIDVDELGVDLLTLDAQKMYGPKGVGALYIRSGVTINPIFWGGRQERALRPGTENIPGIVGMAKAYELIEVEREKEYARVKALQDFFFTAITEKISGATINGSREQRLPNNVNVSIPGKEAQFVVLQLDAKGIAASTKSTCFGDDGEGSPVVRALDGDIDRANSAIRFTLGRFTTQEDIERVVGVLASI